MIYAIYIVIIIVYWGWWGDNPGYTVAFKFNI